MFGPTGDAGCGRDVFVTAVVMVMVAVSSIARCFTDKGAEQTAPCMVVNMYT